MSLASINLWLAMGWNVLQIFHRGTPFVEANVANALLTEISKDCHQALDEVKLHRNYYKILLVGEGLGGTVAANMAAHHPSDFNHMVLVNPDLSLPALVLSRPGLLRKALPLRGPWFSGTDLATAWAASPLSNVQNISSAALIITSRQDTTKQARVFISQQERANMESNHVSQLYRVQPLTQHSTSTTELMLRWANQHYDSYSDVCRIQDSTTTSDSGYWSPTSPTQEVRNPSASATAPSGASCLHLPIPLILVFTVFLTPVVTIMTRRIL